MFVYMTTFHTHNRDNRRDRLTNTVTKRFATREQAVIWGEEESPGCFNVYQWDPSEGWHSVPSKTWPASRS